MGYAVMSDPKSWFKAEAYEEIIQLIKQTNENNENN